MKFVLSFAVVFFFIYTSALAQINEADYLERKGEVYFRFPTVEQQQLNELSRIISLDKVTGKYVYAYANKIELKRFRQAGLQYTLLPHPGDGDEPMSSSIEEITDWNVYPTYDAYINMMYQYESQYPDICRLVDAGTTPQGRKILFAVISDNVNQHEAEPQFMFTSSIHGDETTGFILTLRLIDSLLTTYGSNQRITDIVNDVEIWINPLANPDGTYYGGDHTVNNARRYNSNSVDLNRNFPDPEDGPHPDGNAWQTEAIIMMDIAEANNFIFSANYHGGAEVMNYPWDTWARLHADDAWFQFVSHLYADTAQARSIGTNYLRGFDDGTTNGYAWYTISGGRQDYMNYFHHCREITIEISNTKLLPAYLLERYWYYNNKSMIDYIDNVRYGVKGVVTDFAGNPLKAKIEIAGHDLDSSFIYTDSLTGYYTRMLYSGSYELTVSAPGYQTRIIPGVQVALLTAHQLDIQLLGDNTQLLSPIAAAFPFLGEGKAEFIDYDGDGALDIFMTGGIANSMYTKIYLNEGGDVFTETSTTLPDIWRGTGLWADFNSDSYPDVLISGTSASGPVTQLFMNNTGSGFIQTNHIFTGLEYSAGASADVNRDGLRDFVICGSRQDGSKAAYLYTGNPDSSFDTDSTLLTPVTGGALDFADYDLNGYPDLLIMGDADDGPIAKIYRNVNGVLTETSVALTALTNGSADWVDYNSDGWPDVLLTGGNSESALQNPVLYENNQDGTFTAIPISFASFTGNTAFDAGDYNNDGYPDFLFQGQNSTGAGSTVLLQNNGDGSFLEIPIGFQNFHSGAADWGDYNNDGSLDLLINGYGGSGLVYKSNNTMQNTSPGTPAGLSFVQSDSLITLSWNAASDDNTPAEALTYTCVVGTGAGLQDVVSHSASLIDGTQYLTMPGNSGTNKSFNLSNLSEGTYYWQVQAVDGAYLGGAFSTTDSFTVIFIPDTVGRPLDLSASALTSDFAALQWTDNSDNELGFFIERRDSGTVEFTVIDTAAENAGEFADSTVLPDASYQYRITAYNADTVSAPSNIAGITIPSPEGIDDSEIPEAFALLQNYPNPFNPVTNISFDLPLRALVTITVHSVLGEEMTRLVEKEFPPGRHTVEFNGSHLPSGIYFYTIRTRNYSAVRKMLLLK